MIQIFIIENKSMFSLHFYFFEYVTAENVNAERLIIYNKMSHRKVIVLYMWCDT